MNNTNKKNENSVPNATEDKRSGVCAIKPE